MKKALSLLLAMVLLVTTVASVNLSVLADETIALGETKTISVDEDEEVKISFKPTKDGEYYFYSTGDYDTFCSFEDGDNGTVQSDDIIDYNFCIHHYFYSSTTYVFSIKTYEYDSVTFDITLTETRPEDVSDNSVDKISFTPANEISFYQGVTDWTYDDDEGNYYDVFNLYGKLQVEGNVLKVTYFSGETVIYTSKFVTEYDEESNEEYQELYYISDNAQYDNISSFDLDFDVIIVDKGTVGNEKASLSYGGAIATFDVAIKENPVDHIEYTSGTHLKEGVDNYIYLNDDDELETDYSYTPMENDVLSVFYKDGTTDIFTAVVADEDDYDYEGHVHYVSQNTGEVLEHYLDVSFTYDEDTLFTVGDNTATVNYMGNSTDFVFTIDPTDIVSFEVTPLSSTSLQVGKDSIFSMYSVSYNCPDFRITVTYNDGRTEEYDAIKQFDDDGYYYEFDVDTPFVFEVFDDQWEETWQTGETHQFVIACTENVYDTIDVKITGKCKHTETELFNFSPANFDEYGYTGDEICTTCGKIIKEGTDIPAIGTISVSRKNITYTGTVQRPRITVTDAEGNELEYKKDFKVTWSNINSTNVGTYTANIEFIGNYEGAESRTNKIVPQTNVTPTLSRTTINYTGTVQRPTVTVKDVYGNQLTYKKDFTVSYSNWNSTAVGRYTVTVKMIGNYSGSKTYTYYINPRGTTLSSVSAVSKGFTVKWNKQTTQTTGYQIQYATKSDFSNAATVYGGNANTTSKTITGRAGNTRYYVRIRTYKNIGGKYYYSSWSSAKSVVTSR